MKTWAENTRKIWSSLWRRFSFEIASKRYFWIINVWMLGNDPVCFKPPGHPTVPHLKKKTWAPYCTRSQDMQNHPKVIPESTKKARKIYENPLGLNFWRGSLIFWCPRRDSPRNVIAPADDESRNGWIPLKWFPFLKLDYSQKNKNGKVL